MYIRHIIFAAVIVLVAGYFFYEAKEVILAPGLEILEPVNGATLEASVMRVVGKTRPKLAVWAGGRIFTSNEEGNFEGELPLSPGYKKSFASFCEIKIKDMAYTRSSTYYICQ